MIGLCVAKRRVSNFKTLVLGGGAGGMAVGHRMARYHGEENAVGIVEPSDTHYYQPLWTLVGAGLKSFEQSHKEMKDLMPENAYWHQTTVASFQPDKNAVTLTNGKELTYDNLVVALGLQLNFSNIPGAQEALQADPENGVCSNYSKDTVARTWANIQRIAEKSKSTKCTAVFSQPPMPIKCAGAPQKIMYLAWDHWKKNGNLKNIDIKFCTAMPGIFSQPDYAAAMREIVAKRGIDAIYENNLTAVDGNKAIFAKGEIEFDMLHITPPQGALEICKDSPLADAAGFMDVCPKTLQHKKFENVWALGDCSSIPTSKTAAAIASQNKILAENLVGSLEGDTLPISVYDGYTSCPLVISDQECVLAEFDYKMRKLESFWFDQTKPSKLAYRLKADYLLPIYWHLHCRGNWGGPKPFREVIEMLVRAKNDKY